VPLQVPPFLHELISHLLVEAVDACDDAFDAGAGCEALKLVENEDVWPAEN
jgi:hypothetical protein